MSPALRAAVRSTNQPSLADVVTGGRQMEEVFGAALRAASSDAKVLVTGETGVGKDVVARFIHSHSQRSDRQYVAVNCAGVAESLLESELFGHTKGSFTGAYRDRIGKLQLAHSGTLFLDEVGDMSLRMQALLLRFLENGEIQPVGAEMPSAKVDVRVIAATNRDLPGLVSGGQFREDLLYRLRVVHLHVPPLRERRDEIRPLVSHFLERHGGELSVTDEAWDALRRYRWPGNVRELQNVVEQMAWMADAGVVGLAQLPEAVRTTAQLLVPTRERRRQVADDLYDAIIKNGYSFWDHIHPLFLRRDVTRHDIRELVRLGLSASRGNYRGLLQLFGMPVTDYKRFMNFLSAHNCRVDYREFRNPNHHVSRRAPRILNQLPVLSTTAPTDPAEPDPELATIGSETPSH